MMNNKHPHVDGFTLIETLIYLALISLIVVGFVSFALSLSDARTKVYVAEEVNGNMRLALDVMTQKIRQANAVNTVSSTFNSDPGVLYLGVPNTSASPTIFSLTANDGILQMGEGSTTSTPITSDEVRVTNLVFTDVSGSSTRKNIRIQITMAYTNTSSIQYAFIKSATTTVGIRQ